MYKLLKKTILYTATFILLFVLAGAVCYADTPPRSDEEQPIEVYVNDKKTNETAYTYKGNIYIKVTTLQKYGQTDNITFDGPVNQVYVDISKMDILIGDEETTDFLKANSGKLTFHIRYIQKKYNCVSLGVFGQLCKLDYKYENNKLYLYPLTGEYAKDSNAEVRNYYAPLKEKDTFSRPINMVWQMGTSPTTFTSSDNRTGYVFNCPLAPAKTENIDVMSPLWLTTEINNKGKVFNNCDYGYIELCHANGIKVWICATNNFAASGGASYGNTILKTESYRNKTISQLILYALFYKADGINIDFEGMAHTKTNNVISNEFNTFIADLYKHCSKVGLTLSIDTMLASSYWSIYYNFKFLGENSDYICPMTYNEHWSLESTGAGSTMSRSYYTTMTNNLLKKVPAEKVLMGVPFFTQVWRIDSSGKAVNVWSVTAKRALELITDHKCTPVWNEKDGQYIATYNETSNGSATGYKMKIWVEDERSMAQKLKYVISNNVAGTACWAYSQPTKELLNTFGKVYVHGQDPDTLLGAWPSAADQAAAAALIKPKYSTGDVNGDDTIDANDITDLSRHIAKISEIEDSDMLKACDVDGNGAVDANDLTVLSRYVAKIIDSFDDPGQQTADQPAEQSEPQAGQNQ